MSDLSPVSNLEQSAADDVVTREPTVASAAEASAVEAIASLSAEQVPDIETVSSALADVKEDDVPALDVAGGDAIAQSFQPDISQPPISQPTEPPPSYVKLAMRNMVKKRGTSIKHFAMTTAGLLGLLLGLAYLTR